MQPNIACGKWLKTPRLWDKGNQFKGPISKKYNHFK